MRKYFGTDGIRGKVGHSLVNPEFMLKLGWAVGKVLAHDANPTVLIGKDTRISGYLLESVLEAGFVAAGVNVLLLGPMPTPAIAYLTKTLRAAAGVVISASHNAFEDNGVKFFSSEGLKLSDEMELAIEAQLEKPMETVDSLHLGKATRVDDAPGRYIEFCKSTFPSQLTLGGLKVGLDCANGATYYVAKCILRELGADVITIGDDPDGLNINLNCGALHTEQLRAVVLEQHCDVGIALDGDGDRLIMVDHKGEEVDGDEILGILAIDRKRRLQGGFGVVGTLMSNLGLELALKEHDIGFERAKVGDRYVMQRLQSLGWSLGGESSGHIVDLGLTTTGDGMITALQVLGVIQTHESSLSVLKQVIQKCPQVLINIRVENPDKVIESDAIQAAAKVAEEKLADRGRILLRASGTEPLVRVMVEGRDAEEVKATAEQLADFVKDAALS
ncbi:MAG: phosphoglucosamine mutase [Coxiellaceae bacterium]|nr:phosphoglucosamine mutase [Coxiellaceae bacterium]